MRIVYGGIVSCDVTHRGYGWVFIQRRSFFGVNNWTALSKAMITYTVITLWLTRFSSSFSSLEFSPSFARIFIKKNNPPHPMLVYLPLCFRLANLFPEPLVMHKHYRLCHAWQLQHDLISLYTFFSFFL